MLLQKTQVGSQRQVGISQLQGIHDPLLTSLDTCINKIYIDNSMLTYINKYFLNSFFFKQRLHFVL